MAQESQFNAYSEAPGTLALVDANNIIGTAIQDTLRRCVDQNPDLEARIPEELRRPRKDGFNLFPHDQQEAEQQLPEVPWRERGEDGLPGRYWTDVALDLVKEHIWKLYNIGQKFPVVLVFDPSGKRLEMKVEDAVAVMQRNAVPEDVISAAYPCIQKALDRSPEMNQQTNEVKEHRADSRGSFPPAFLRNSHNMGRRHKRLNFLRPSDRADGALEQKWLHFNGQRIPLLSVRAKLREADDLIALLVRKVHEVMPDTPIRIQSSDRDLMMCMLWPNITINRKPDEDWTLEKEGCKDAPSVRRKTALHGKSGDWIRLPMTLYAGCIGGDYHHRMEQAKLYNDEQALHAFLYDVGQRELALRVRRGEDENGEARFYITTEPRSNELFGRLWSNLIMMNIDPGSSEFSWLPPDVFHSLCGLADTVCLGLRDWRKGTWRGESRRQGIPNVQQNGSGNGGRGRGCSAWNARGGRAGGGGGFGGRGRGGRG